MNKTIYSIDEILNLWDMKSDIKERKKEIISSWKEILDDDTYNMLLEITKEIIFYSDDKVGMYFKDIFPKEKEENNNGNCLFFGDEDQLLVSRLSEFEIAKANYYPLRTEERVESSNTIFLNFYKSIGIPVAYTKMDKPDFLLEKKLQFEEVVNTYEEILAIDEDEEISEEYVNYVHENYKLFELEYIFFVDDFFGSGSSVRDFLLSLEKYYPIFRKVTLVFLVLEISQNAIDILTKVSKEKGIRFIVIYYRLSSNIFYTLYEGEKLDEIINKVKKFNIDFELKESDYCINNIAVSYVNSPNNNVPFIYFKSNKWSPIFYREEKRDLPKPSKKKIREKLKKSRGK